MGCRARFVASLCMAVFSSAVSQSLTTMGRRDQEGSIHYVSSEADLQQVFSALEENDNVVIVTHNLKLTETLRIEVAGVTIEGLGNGSTVLECPQRSQTSGVVIKSNIVRVSSLTFTHCDGASAVVVESNRRLGEAPMHTRFENVTFSQNGRNDSVVNGAALRVGACHGDGCLSPTVTVVNCTFSGNSGQRGGAIYAEDANLDIRSSTFHGNVARLAGGAIYLGSQRGATARVRVTTFENNAALSDPLYEEELMTVIRTAAIEVSGRGGAIFADSPVSLVIRDGIFLGNVGCRGGGAIAVTHSELLPGGDSPFAFQLSHSLLADNVGYCGSQRNALLDPPGAYAGGALLYQSLDETTVAWDVSRTSFLRNRARMGGGVSLQASVPSTAQHRLDLCTFDENIALSSGGSLAAWTTRLRVTRTSFLRSRAVYGGGLLIWQGAFATFAVHPADPTAVSRIENVIGIYGGGMLLDTRAGLNASALHIRGNTGLRNGGAIRMDDTRHTIALRGVLIENNRAIVGGGVAISALESILITSDGERRTLFRNNTAAVGGGLFYEPGQSIALGLTIEYTDFIGNRALGLSSPEMKSMLELAETYTPLESAGVLTPSLIENLGNFTLLSSLASVEEGHGGGVCITVLNIRFFVVAEFFLREVSLRENSAVVGGGLSVHQTSLGWNRERKASCYPAAPGVDACQLFLLYRVNITENEAGYAGGVYSTLSHGIMISCDESLETPFQLAQDVINEEFSRDQSRAFCTNFLNNSVLDGGNPAVANAATGAFFLAVEGWDGPLKQVASGEKLVIPCEDTSNASCSRPLRIVIQNFFEQTIVGGIPDADLELRLSSPFIVGDLRYTASKGIAEIDNTWTRGTNISDTLVIESERDSSIRLELEFSTRECYPGEIISDDSCRACLPERYGFEPSLGWCGSCETNAICSGGAMLAPVDGYWHSTPFSPIFRSCLYRYACAYEGREETLREYYADSTKLVELLKQLNASSERHGGEPAFEDYPQCATGYSGLLCGSCEDDYGRSADGACEKCPSTGTPYGIFVGAGWTFVLIGANCAITLLSMNARVALVKHEEEENIRRHPSRLPRASPIRTDPHASRDLLYDSDSEGNSEESIGHDPSLFAKQLVATVQLTETLKILVNYLQVTAAAVQLQTDWSALLDGLLAAEGVLIGLQGVALSVPYECNFRGGGGMPPSISAQWMRLATPWLVLLALLLVCVLYSAMLCFLHRRNPSGSQQLKRERFLTWLIVICVVAMYFSYIDVVRELLKAVHCVEIEDEEGAMDPDHPYRNYAVEKVGQTVWAEDTSIVCYEGYHLPLGVVSIAGLFISLCGILTIILWLPLNRKHVIETEFVARYWFLFQAYRKQWYRAAWESTILTRKALIAALVVFSVHLGTTLQAALCAGVLVIFYFLHSVFQPFKIPRNPEYVPNYARSPVARLGVARLMAAFVHYSNKVHLNDLETASPCSSVLMFMMAVVLHEEQTTSVGRSLITSIAFSVNCTFLLYMLFRLNAGAHTLVDVKLSLADPSISLFEEKSLGVFSLLKKGFQLLDILRKTKEREMDNGDTGNDFLGRIRLEGIELTPHQTI